MFWSIKAGNPCHKANDTKQICTGITNRSVLTQVKSSETALRGRIPATARTGFWPWPHRDDQTGRLPALQIPCLLQTPRTLIRTTAKPHTRKELCKAWTTQTVLTRSRKNPWGGVHVSTENSICFRSKWAISWAHGRSEPHICRDYVSSPDSDYDLTNPCQHMLFSIQPPLP